LIGAVVVSHVANIELELGMIQGDAHVFLFLFVAAEDAYLGDVGGEEAFEHGVAEGARATGDHQYFVFEHSNQS